MPSPKFCMYYLYAGTETNVENMFYVLFVLVGIGTIIHSMVTIAYISCL